MMSAVEEFREHDRAQEDTPRRNRHQSGRHLRFRSTPKMIDPRVGVEQVVHDKGSRSSYSPWSGRSNSPCHLPAVDRTMRRHSSPEMGAAGSGSTVTCTSLSAALRPTGRLKWRMPSPPTLDFTTIRFIVVLRHPVQVHL